MRQVQRWQRESLRQRGTRLVFAADELYLLAGLRLPARPQYEGFWQLGNGIGGARLLLDQVRRLRPLRLRQRLRVTLVTGEGAAGLVKLLAGKLEAGGGVQAQVQVVPNRMLGRSVTTAGLLAGRDIARALRAGKVGEMVLVPASAIREGEGFLDGMTLAELSGRVGAPVAAAGSPREAAAALREFDRGRGER